MILSDSQIKKEIENGDLGVTGVEKVYIGSNSIDLHLDNKAMILYRDPLDEMITIRMDEDKEHFREFNGWKEITIHPGDFYILHTKEKLTFPDDIAGFVQGRSSIARMGISVECAGFVDSGFEGTITLEVTNFTSHPIVIPAHTRICQIVFHRVEGKVEVDYKQKKDSKYFGQDVPKTSRGYKDYAKNN
jgi:dCTP deaminase|tara:strand:+ start:540 stop:1106 length:567 start_codon:yes stop_codon:yes gene_type:complete